MYLTNLFVTIDSYDACITDVVLSDDDGDEFGAIVGDCIDLTMSRRCRSRWFM